MTDSSSTRRVLAIDPTTSGFGFSLFEGPERLIDWGTRTASRDTNAQSLKLVAALMDHYTPAVVVVEDTTKKCSRRCPRVRDLVRNICDLAAQKGLKAHRISRRQVRQVYEDCNAITKHEMASCIAVQFPELALRLPPRRKPWMSEDSRISIFDAVALALAFFDHLSDNRSRPTPVT